MTFYPNQLSKKHEHQLFVESANAPEIAAERGYYTARRRAEVPKGFADYQHRLGLVVPMYSPDGDSTSYQLRPDKPRRGGPKYETPAGSKVLVDVHPRMLEEVRSGREDLWITEGAKKGDALTSRGLPTLSLAGVWMWCVPKVRPYKLKPCFDHVQLKGRRVYVVFDSDAPTKWEVQQALEALVKALEECDAEVLVVYLEDAPDGSKVGVDDYLASEAGGTVKELKMLARKFEPEDLGRIRLSRDDRLRALVEDLERRFWSEEWKGMGGHSARDVYLKLIEAARRHGKVVDGGIRVTKAQGPLFIEAKVSPRTGWKALNRLEEWGLVYRDNEGRKPDKSGAFVLRASVSHKGEGPGHEGKEAQELRESDPGDLHLRAPRQRWSRPKFTPKRGTVRGTRKVREAPKPEPRDRIERLGKIRGAILDVLDAAGGTATLREIADALHRKRPRDIRRRNLPMLEEAGILAVDGDTVTLAEDWLDRLEEARALGQEIEADEVARVRYKEKSRGYHNRRKANPDPHWTNNPDADGAIEDLRPAEGPEPEKEPEPKEDPAVAVVLDYVARLGKIRLGLLEEIWLEDHGGDLKELRRAVDESGVRKERLREHRDAVFLYPPGDQDGKAA